MLPGALLMLFSDKIVGICISFMSTYIDSRYSMYVGMAEKSNVINFGLRMVILFLLCFFYRRVQCEKRDKLLAASTLCYLVGAFNGSYLCVRWNMLPLAIMVGWLWYTGRFPVRARASL